MNGHPGTLQLSPFQHGNDFFSCSVSFALLRNPEVADVERDLAELVRPEVRLEDLPRFEERSELRPELLLDREVRPEDLLDFEAERRVSRTGAAVCFFLLLSRSFCFSSPDRPDLGSVTGAALFACFFRNSAFALLSCENVQSLPLVQFPASQKLQRVLPGVAAEVGWRGRRPSPA